MAVVNLGHWLAVRLADFAGIASQAGIGQEAYYSGTVSFQAPFTSAFAAFRQPHDLPGMGKQVRGLAKYGEFTQHVCKKNAAARCTTARITNASR